MKVEITCWSNPHESSESAPECHTETPELLKRIHNEIVFLLLNWFSNWLGGCAWSGDGGVTDGFWEHRIIHWIYINYKQCQN